MTAFFKRHKVIIVLFYLLMASVLWCINGWNYSFLDTINYLWLADRYAEGNFDQAVNTYWGPMISWLLLVLKPVISAPFLRFRILQLILGLFTVFEFHAILKKQTPNAGYTLICSLIAAVLFISYAWFYLTPDLLLLLMSLVFVNQLLDHKYSLARNAIKFGLLGALMYFAKSAGFLFFLVIIGGKFITERKQWNFQGLKFNFLTVVFFLLFCSPWILAISKKNGSFTIGTGSIHNYKLNSPVITPDLYGELGSPFNLGKLTEPVSPGDFDAWIEPAHQDYLSWEGMSGTEIRSYYSKVVIRNLKSARSMYFGLDAGSVFLVLCFAALTLARKEFRSFIKKYSPLFFLFMANVLVYLPFFFMGRYTWPGVAALVLLILLIQAEITVLRPVLVRACTLILLSGLFSFTLFKEYSTVQQDEKFVRAIWQTKGELKLDRTAFISKKGDLRLGLAGGVTYLNGGRYFGSLWFDASSPAEVKAELKRCRISNIVCFDPEAREFVFKTIENQVLFKTEGLTVFKIDSTAF